MLMHKIDFQGKGGSRPNHPRQCLTDHDEMADKRKENDSTLCCGKENQGCKDGGEPGDVFLRLHD